MLSVLKVLSILILQLLHYFWHLEDNRCCAHRVDDLRCCLDAEQGRECKAADNPAGRFGRFNGKGGMLLNSTSLAKKRDFLLFYQCFEFYCLWSGCKRNLKHCSWSHRLYCWHTGGSCMKAVHCFSSEFCWEDFRTRICGSLLWIWGRKLVKRDGDAKDGSGNGVLGGSVVRGTCTRGDKEVLCQPAAILSYFRVWIAAHLCKL